MKKTIITAFLSLALISTCYGQANQSLAPEPAITQESDTQQTTPPSQKGSFTISPLYRYGISPKRILVEMKPGDFYEDAIIAHNLTDSEMSLHLYASDDTSSSEDNISATMDTVEQKNAGKWTRFAESEITLAPGEKKEIKFMILVPEKTPPDVYKGGLAAVYMMPYTGGAVKTAIRYVIGTTITVTDDPKPIPMVPKEGEINIFSSGTPYFWGSIALFVTGMGYFIWGSLHEKKKKNLPNKS